MNFDPLFFLVPKNFGLIFVDSFTNLSVSRILFLQQTLADSVNQLDLWQIIADHFKCCQVLLQCYDIFWEGRISGLDNWKSWAVKVNTQLNTDDSSCYWS